MILTLTPNPSIDRTITLAGELARGQVQRVVSVTSQAGGKGVNISRASVGAGEPTLAVLPAAKDDPFVIELLSAGIDCRPVLPAGDVRVNVTITEPDGTTTKLNSPGATVEAHHLEAMVSTLLARAAAASWTVLAGSLPAGAPPEFYAELVRRLRALGAQVAVDTSEAPLRALVDALPGSAPDLMKPNGDELASFAGGDAVELEKDPAKAAEAARTLIERGVGTVLATLGGNGAVLVNADGAWHAAPPPTTVVSTVGAGDSSLFGYLLGDIRGLPAPDRLALAVAYGSAAAGLPGTTIPEPAHVHAELVTVTVLGGRPMIDLINIQLVRLDAGWGAEKADVIRGLAAVVNDADRADDLDQLIADAFAREETSSTGLPGGIAIPHCRTTGVSEPTLAFARLDPPVDFGAKDGPADLAFLIAAPAGGDATHLQLLTKLARSLVKPAFTDSLRSADTPEEVVDLIDHALNEPAKPTAASASAPAPAAAAVAVASAAPDSGGSEAPGAKSLVAVTACPTGIAHTYMAAEALEAAAEKAGIQISVETQGSAGSTPLAPETIANAAAVIFAVDVGVRDRSRFAGKPMVSSGVKRPIDDADAMIAEALRYADDPSSAPKVEGTASEAGTSSTAQETWGGRTRRVLMTGVSYMIPFVAAGGLLIALSFLLGGYEIVGPYGDIAVNNTLFSPPDVNALGLDHALFGSGVLAYIGAIFFIIGKTAFMFFVPALAGYIAYAIADRPGIAPGFVMGGLAINIFNVQTSADDPVGLAQTGFLGAIVGGVLAGVIAHWLTQRKVPSWARGLMPVLVIPLATSIVAGLLMILVFGKPISWLMTQLTDGLNSMSGSNAIVLGVILGLMMAFDMGGPLNKVAYSFAAAGVGTAAAASADAPELKIMAAVMLAGMVPPIALALSTVVRPGLYTPAERENGKAGWLLGASFITEGAIPFAAADPLRVIPAIMAGSAVTGGLSMALDVSVRAPHGGIFVLFAVSNIVGYLISLAAGVLVGAALVTIVKSRGTADPDVATV